MSARRIVLGQNTASAITGLELNNQDSCILGFVNRKLTDEEFDSWTGDMEDDIITGTAPDDAVILEFTTAESVLKAINDLQVFYTYLLELEMWKVNVAKHELSTSNITK